MIVKVKDVENSGVMKVAVFGTKAPLSNFVHYVEFTTGKSLKWIRRGNAK